MSLYMNEDFGGRSGYVSQGQVTASHSILWDAITYSCLRYLLLKPKSTNTVMEWAQGISFKKSFLVHLILAVCKSIPCAYRYFLFQNYIFITDAKRSLVPLLLMKSQY